MRIYLHYFQHYRGGVACLAVSFSVFLYNALENFILHQWPFEPQE